MIMGKSKWSREQIIKSLAPDKETKDEVPEVEIKKRGRPKKNAVPATDTM